MHRLVVLVVILGVVAPLQGQEPPPPANPSSAPPGAPGGEKLAKEIGMLLDRLSLALAKKQQDEIRRIFAESGEWVDDTGRVFVGLEEINRVNAELVASFPGLTLAYRPELTRSLGATVAIVDGVRSTSRGDPPEVETGRFTALFAREGETWKLVSLREFADAAAAPPGEKLAALDWMIGEWVDESSDSEIRLSCRRSDDGAYLLRDFTVLVAGKVKVQSTQRLAWDPILRQIRSWNFDSDGGFGEGLWIKDGDRWIVRTSSVLADGRTASAVHVLTPQGKDKVQWQSSVRIVGDALEPDLEAVMVRRPPKADARGAE